LATGDVEGADRLLLREADRFASASAFASDHPAALEFTRARGSVSLRRGRVAEAAELLGAAIRGASNLEGNPVEPLWLVEAAEAESVLGHADRVQAYLESVPVTSELLPPELRERIERLRADAPS
jgi:hypothetical protein